MGIDLDTAGRIDAQLAAAEEELLGWTMNGRLTSSSRVLAYIRRARLMLLITPEERDRLALESIIDQIGRSAWYREMFENVVRARLRDVYPDLLKPPSSAER